MTNFEPQIFVQQLKISFCAGASPHNQPREQRWGEDSRILVSRRRKRWGPFFWVTLGLCWILLHSAMKQWDTCRELLLSQLTTAAYALPPWLSKLCNVFNRQTQNTGLINDRKIEEPCARDSPGLSTIRNKEESLLSLCSSTCTHLII